MQWMKGTTIQNGKYVIEDILGQGCFGTTHKARHTEVNQYVRSRRQMLSSRTTRTIRSTSRALL